MTTLSTDFRLSVRVPLNTHFIRRNLGCITLCKLDFIKDTGDKFNGNDLSGYLICCRAGIIDVEKV